MRVLLRSILVFSFFAVLTAAGSSQPADAEDKTKLADDIQKQIKELQAKLKEMKDAAPPKPKAKSMSALDGTPTADWNKMLAWRCIGPANMGGRITSLAVYEADPTTYYVATASGGLLKTVNNGSTFEHQFDKEATISIGAVAVAPTNRDIVWVGTGEANPRNSVSWGDGVYKSTDGGKTWKNMGLKKTFQIGRIIVHPKNPDIVYVGALGRLYGPNEERGLFKTTDGGKTWDKILFIDDNTGVIDFVMNPGDSESLLVALWERQRDEFDSFRGDAKAPPGSDEYAPSKVHGAGGGLHKTTDGGKSWKKITHGLPKGKLGRIGLDWHQKNHKLLYAIVDSENIGKGVPPSNAYLGLSPENSPQGVKVASVAENGPAAKAGILKDDILLAIDGKDVKAAPFVLIAMQGKQPNDKIKITVQRDKERKEIEVTLGQRPVKGAPGEPQRGSLGIQVEEADEGLVVSEITEAGPASIAGIKVGDLLKAIDGVKLDSTRAMLKTLFDKKIGDTVKLIYQRGKETREIELALQAPRQGTPDRPYGGRLGGQRENVQGQQGPDGDNTGGVYKSSDGGDSWSRVNSVNERPFYFSVVRSDPSDDKTVYFLGINLYRSTDGGKTFAAKDINTGLHSDHHELWINPKDGRDLLIATDGGFYVSHDRAAHWEHLNHFSLGQFYHIAVDNRKPYRVYGGLQDNGTWGVPSQTLRPSGPGNADALYVNGGDGFMCRVDPNDPDLIYAESQDGSLLRRHLTKGGGTPIRPKTSAGAGKYRFNWNTPFILSAQNSMIYYCAGNVVFRSTKQGDNLKIISPEITRTKRGSATALAESPLNPDVLWVGSDDGAVWITRDGGKAWSSLSDHFKPAGLPGPRWVATIEPSRAAAGRCYVVFDAHRSNDDEAYVFVTEDFGETWKSLKNNLPAGSTRVLREDLVNPDLLYLGTEFGFYASVNRGASWSKLNGTVLPTVAVHEVAQPTTASEIVLATHGRGIWVLDVTTLRQLKPDHAKDKSNLFAPAPVTRWLLDSTREGMFKTGTRAFVGQNPPRNASIDFVLASKADTLSLKIVDIQGKLVREFNMDKEKDAGFHRIGWDLLTGTLAQEAKGKGGKEGKGGGKFAGGPPAPDGVQQAKNGLYRVVLEVDGKEIGQPIRIDPDPSQRNDSLLTDDAEEDRLLRRFFNRLTPDLEP